MKTFTISILFLALSLITNSQTIIPGGDVSGTWTQANSPYLIEGNIKRTQSATLTIEPGVDVVFEDYYTFDIYGNFYAIGSISDSISFTVSDTTGYFNGTNSGWGGLKFPEFSDCEINYCKVEFSKHYGLSFSAPGFFLYTIANSIIRYNQSGGIYLEIGHLQLNNIKIYRNNGNGILSWYEGNVTIENFEIKNNLGSGISFLGPWEFALYANNGFIVDNKGGGIKCHSDTYAEISNVSVLNNGPTDIGGGIYLNGILNLDESIIENNVADDGGGIYCSVYPTARCKITNSIIKNNNASNRGGGIAFIGLVACQISNTKICNNSANDGGGIYDSGGGNGGCGLSTYNQVLISNNHALNKGGGIYMIGLASHLWMNHLTMINNIADNSGGGIIYDNLSGFYTPPNISNSIIWNNLPEEIVDTANILSVLYSDIKGGWSGVEIINQDPLFLDPDNQDYHLTWANFPINDYSKSPCIDAGSLEYNPDPCYSDSIPNIDPDSTLGDLGTFYFDQLTAVNSEPP